GLEAKDSLERVVAAAHRMSRLIDDLLLLSRIERRTVSRTSVELSAIAWQVMADLSTVDRSRDVEVEIAHPLYVVADRGLLRILLATLLGNAGKSTAKPAGARIEVGVVRPGEPVYFIRDNGAGFDAANADRLFTPFQRYHSEREFSGTGVGLATARRIV